MQGHANLKPGPGFRPGRAALYYAQRAATLPSVRRWVSRGIATAINGTHRRRARDVLSPAAREQCSRALTLLQHDGYTGMEEPIPPAMIADIMTYLSDKEVVLPDGKRSALDELPAGTRMASYSLDCALRCPAILEVINYPVVLHLATRYLGCTPTLSSLAVRWSLPAPTGAVDTQLFHRDPDDWKFLKFFVYLTDVDSESGPHMFVRKSHRTAGRLRERPYPLGEIEKQFGQNAVLTITGPAGTSFVADTYGIHRGAVPRKRPRLILQAQYSLLPVFSFLYRPVAVKPRPNVDAYINRLLLARP